MECDHEGLNELIVNSPKTSYDAVGTGAEKCSRKPRESARTTGMIDARLAGGQHD
jgi:hypothetical protein